MLTNYHTHTTRCGHAEGTEEEYILTALRCGYKVLGFSDHTPWAYATPGFVSRIRMLPSQLDDYVLTLRGLRENMPTSSTSASALRQSISRPIWAGSGKRRSGWTSNISSSAVTTTPPTSRTPEPAASAAAPPRPTAGGMPNRWWKRWKRGFTGIWPTPTSF